MEIKKPAPKSWLYKLTMSGNLAQHPRHGGKSHIIRPTFDLM